MARKHILSSPAATMRFGAQLTRRLRPGSIIVLEGPLGSGKTTLVKGLARALGVRQPVTSPTFVLRKRYQLNNKFAALNHMDAYRFQTPTEFFGVLDEFLENNDGEVWVIEWGGKLQSLLPNHHILHIQLGFHGTSGRFALFI